MIISVHQPQYIPWLGYFEKIAKSDCFVFLDNVQYKHREFQNRNKIRGSKNFIWLTVPVITKNYRQQLIADVRIDNSEPWPKKHWHALQSCYSQAKFFYEYGNFFRAVYLDKTWDKLIDFNIYIIEQIISWLDIKTKIIRESQVGTTLTSTGRIIEICRKLNAQVYLSGLGGKDYLQEDMFVQSGIKLEYQQFTHPVYQQQFMCNVDDFMPYLSIIDLLFNEGADKSRAIIIRR
jgi:hypothetical protein